MIGNDWKRLFWIGGKKARKGDGAIGEGQQRGDVLRKLAAEERRMTGEEKVMDLCNRSS